MPGFATYHVIFESRTVARVLCHVSEICSAVQSSNQTAQQPTADIYLWANEHVNYDSPETNCAPNSQPNSRTKNKRRQATTKNDEVTKSSVDG